MTIADSVVQYLRENAKASSAFTFGLVERDVGAPLKFRFFDLFFAGKYNSDRHTYLRLDSASSKGLPAETSRRRQTSSALGSWLVSESKTANSSPPNRATVSA